MIEALACGTPVIARPYGAAPEVVRDGEVGYLADSLDDLVAGVKRVDPIDRPRLLLLAGLELAGEDLGRRPVGGNPATRRVWPATVERAGGTSGCWGVGCR